LAGILVRGGARSLGLGRKVGERKEVSLPLRRSLKKELGPTQKKSLIFSLEMASFGKF